MLSLARRTSIRYSICTSQGATSGANASALHASGPRAALQERRNCKVRSERFEEWRGVRHAVRLVRSGKLEAQRMRHNFWART